MNGGKWPSVTVKEALEVAIPIALKLPKSGRSHRAVGK
jgi:hypothetical protein